MSLHDLAKRIPQLQDVNFSSLTFKELTGWSNRNYLLTHQNKKFVLREPIASREEGVNREAEWFNTNQAANAGIGCSFLYFDSHTGICLREFIEGETPVDNNGNVWPHLLQGIAETFKRLHAHPVRFINDVNYFSVIAKTVHYIHQYSNDALPEYTVLLREANKVNVCLAKHPADSVPCHNDPNPLNFLYVNDKIYLLDWEFSGNGDRAWDLAYFITTGDLDEASERTLLDHYFCGNMSDEQYHRIMLYKPITLLVFSLWIRLQRTKKYLPVSLEDLIHREKKLTQDIQMYFESIR